jgi:hypothetical protein
MDLTVCPDCGQTAEIEDRHVLESTDGPIEHACVRCLVGHWFFMPVDKLSSPALGQAQPAAVPPGPRRR